MSGRIAIHATHEAADKLGGIGTVLAGLLPEPDYRAAFPRSLLVGVYPFPTEGSVIDDPELRTRAGWQVEFDSRAERRRSEPLTEALAEVAGLYGIRLVYGRREIVRGTPVPALIASPQQIRREPVDDFRRRLRREHGFDLERFDDFPAIVDGVDRRLERLLRGEANLPDEPEAVVVDQRGNPLPGGAGWVHGRAVFPPVVALDSFDGWGRGNKYLLELQYHTFVAPALWAGVRAILREWRAAEPAEAVLFAHDWVGVPLWWAMRSAGDSVERSVYFAHEARIFRLLAEGALRDRQALLKAVCHPDGHDAALYPHLATALHSGWDLSAMFPGTVGFPDIFHHQLNREAANFDRVVAVGPLVKAEMEVALRPADVGEIALCPNGIPSRPVTADAARAAHERLADLAEANLGFRPDLILTGVMRCELSKAPWRNVGLFRRLTQLRDDLKILFVWLSAPRPRPTPAQRQRWARDYRWPLDHRAGDGGDLRADEAALWSAIAEANAACQGRGALLYINQFGWSPELLGALDPGPATFADLRCGSDVEVGLSVYEPFGIAPLEPFSAGALCVLSDACGCARHLADLGLAERVVIGRFTDHGRRPRQVDMTVRREIETAVYEQLTAEIVDRLGLTDGPVTEADWLARRAERIAAAAACVDHLSWAHALRSYLLPAVVGDLA